jgi:vesicle transport through interaction with t-SNAREs 1
MEIEIQGIHQSIRPQYQSRIRTFKSDLARYKKLSREMHAQVSRADIFSSPNGGAPATSDEPYGSSDRARLLAGTTILEDGSRRLQESQRIALETEEQGTDILRSLVGQREQIENARNTVRVPTVVNVHCNLTSLQLQSTDTSIDRASGTLKKMIRRWVPSLFVPCRSRPMHLSGDLMYFYCHSRMYQQRFVTAAIIITLVILIGFIVWGKLRR